ncbi:hypothetical protein PVK06_008355 [Gossypium arboreum]|uniref:Uncharacterized protein n=1 Tax=Gossypium arboreum TaxID=29729 RepID=A0ABR0QKK8_GOSAR|nr:hypothetical protein PVK06_008355 [Gossypium arboreum]
MFSLTSSVRFGSFPFFPSKSHEADLKKKKRNNKNSSRSFFGAAGNVFAFMNRYDNGPNKEDVLRVLECTSCVRMCFVFQDARRAPVCTMSVYFPYFCLSDDALRC